MSGLEFLSMGWLYAAPAFIGALVLLYFLKLKRREVAVSSTYLWRDALDDLRVNSPFQRLRMNLLLILQLLVLILVILALARPVSSLGGAQGYDKIILIDVSASMNATDGGSETRLDRAKQEAKEIVENLSYGDRACVIAFSNEARFVVDPTDSRANLIRSIDELQATDRPTRLANALQLVKAVLDRSNRKPAVFLFSDGRVGSLEGATLDADVPFNYVRLGERDDNVGIVAFKVFQESSGEDPLLTLLVTALNTGSTTRTVGFDLKLDGELRTSREATLEPGKEATVTFEVSAPPVGRVLQAHISLDHDGPDVLSSDDEVWAILRPQEPTHVLLVSDGNPFLENALNEDPQVQKTPAGKVPRMLPKDFRVAANARDASLYVYDVIVLDRVQAERLPPGNYLTFLTPPPFEGLKDEGQVEESDDVKIEVVEWLETHPTTRFVNFDTLVLPTARNLKIRPRDEVIVTATHGPLILECEGEDQQRAIVCAFDLMALPADNPWTIDPSFPIFIFNTIRFLGPGGSNPNKDTLVDTGDVAELRFPPGIAKASVRFLPDGEERDLTIGRSAKVLHVPHLDRAGIYQVVFKDAEGKSAREMKFAANLLDAEESAVGPAENITVEDREVKGEEETQDTRSEDLWKWLVMAALAFVLLEWWIYNRRVFI